MNSLESIPHDARSSDPQASVSGGLPHVNFWVRELPYSIVLVLTLLGIAYTSVLNEPISAYWELLAPLIGLICIGSGWQHADHKAARLQLIWTQALHWFAFLVVMNIILLPSVQRTLNANATGLAIFTLLALGTFTAGVHVLSWQICLLGLVMALGIPAIAWIENASLIFALFAGLAVGIGAVIWWRWHERRASKT